MTFRQHLFLLFKEAINNSLKYSNCTELELDISITGNQLTLMLSDNGKGFFIEKVKKGDGLLNMQERAEAINGVLEFKSQNNKGTTIIFRGNY